MGDAKISDPGQLTISSKLKTVYSAFIFVGIIGFVVMMINDKQRAWLAFLLPLFYFTSLALGGLFFTAIQHVTKAGWSVNVRRISESFTGFLPIAAIGSALLLVGGKYLYKWFDHGTVAGDALLHHKSSYLNLTFFVVRLAVFFGAWIIFSRIMIGRSLKQDNNPDPMLTVKQVGTGVAFLLFFSLSYSFFSVDLLMSLEAHFFSTIYGVYAFAGLFQSTLAFMILTIIYLKKQNLLQGFVDENHLHDLGKFLFAFTIFWAYIAFSQYMLIWYANLPEETLFIIPRTENGWLWVSIFLLVGKFIVPFLALLPQWAKRSSAHLAVISIWMLVMQYVDLYWLAYPAFYEEEVKFSLGEVAIFLGFLGLFLMTTAKFLSSNKVVAVGDPRIQESMHHHVVY
jgi:hypothetical protein